MPLLCQVARRLALPPCPGGEIGRRNGLKIRRWNTPCRFDSGPGHHFEKTSVSKRLK